MLPISVWITLAAKSSGAGAGAGMAIALLRRAKIAMAKTLLDCILVLL